MYVAAWVLVPPRDRVGGVVVHILRSRFPDRIQVRAFDKDDVVLAADQWDIMAPVTDPLLCGQTSNSIGIMTVTNTVVTGCGGSALPMVVVYKIVCSCVPLTTVCACAHTATAVKKGRMRIVSVKREIE